MSVGPLYAAFEENPWHAHWIQKVPLVFLQKPLHNFSVHPSSKHLHPHRRRLLREGCFGALLCSGSIRNLANDNSSEFGASFLFRTSGGWKVPPACRFWSSSQLFAAQKDCSRRLDLPEQECFPASGRSTDPVVRYFTKIESLPVLSLPIMPSYRALQVSQCCFIFIMQSYGQLLLVRNWSTKYTAWMERCSSIIIVVCKTPKIHSAFVFLYPELTFSGK